MSEITYREAVTKALAAELSHDPDVFLIGEDIAAAGGVFKATEGLRERFGEGRVRDTPISEQAIVGCVLGAALTGLRPIAEIMFADFAGTCFDQIANQVAKFRHMSGGQASVPVTLRLANGAGVGFAAQHSQSVENWFLNVPGLKICVPSTPADVYGLLRAAIRDDNPVLVFEHKALYPLRGAPPPDDHLIALGTASVVREGGDVTVVATQLMRHRADEAAAELANEEIDVEIVDLRTLSPLDIDTVKASVEKTSRLVCITESPLPGSWATTVVARVSSEAFETLDCAPAIIAGGDSPIPYAGSLEERWLPSVDRIAAVIREVVRQ